ncbi:endonuclease NucS [Bifidobacterium aquikefiricola]|uniref:Endonuclease NucS n=1 Tax=Bifidobacterium aquikefiricola TaxID=3059038 RepID=A0AB39U5Y2_9BIFI
MRIIVADCSARYAGRLNASLDRAKRVLLIKADSSCLIFSELGSYKPLNWMTAPCTLHESVPQDCDITQKVDADIAGKAGIAGKTGKANKADIASVAEDDEALSDACIPEKVIRVCADKSDDVLTIDLWHIYSDQTHELGIDPGLVKDGVEDHLQHYLAEQIDRIGKGARLVRREYPTAIGPVDIMAIDAEGNHVAIEIKRHGGIDGVEQLTRYCTLLNRDPLLAPVRGIFAAQTITPQAKVLAEDRGFHCLILDYESMKHTESDTLTLF